jgi:hypothetical protein
VTLPNEKIRWNGPADHEVLYELATPVKPEHVAFGDNACGGETTKLKVAKAG